MTEMSERLAEVVGSLEGSTKSHMKFGNEVEIERLETPSIALTKALGGGWAMGRFGLLWGPKSAGKSTFLFQQIAIAQRKGLVCAYFDVERSFDKKWAKALGVDIDELIIMESRTVNSLVNDGHELMDAGVDFISVDSLSFIMPSTYLDDGDELKPHEKTGAIGGLARSMSAALSQLTYANNNDTLWIFVSQVRMAQKGSMHWGASPTGGKGVDHATSQSVKLFASEGKDAVTNGEVVIGDRLITKPIGRDVSWLIDKDRVGPGYKSQGEYKLYFDGDFLGIDHYEEIIDLAVMSGVIEKAGAWYKYDGRQIGQGKTNAAGFLRENDDVFEKVKEGIYGG